LPDGKNVFSKRVRFQVQDLMDLRGNKWQKKLFKEQATTKSAVRDAAWKEETSKVKKGTEAMFSTKVVGVRPAYIDELKVQATAQKAAQQKVLEQQKPSFDQQYVKKLFQYFAEEKNGDNLQADWAKAQPSAAQAKQGLVWLLEIGFQDVHKQEATALTLVELMKRRVVQWETLRDALSPFLLQLADLKIDTPNCDVFFHFLLSKLLLLGDGFNPVVLKSFEKMLADPEQHGFAWTLLTGSLSKVRQAGGPDAVRRALNLQDLIWVAKSVKNCSPAEAKTKLENES